MHSRVSADMRKCHVDTVCTILNEAASACVLSHANEKTLRRWPVSFRAFPAIDMNFYSHFRNDVAFYPAHLYEGEDRDVHR